MEGTNACTIKVKLAWKTGQLMKLSATTIL
jgi:hypothetical protein